MYKQMGVTLLKKKNLQKNVAAQIWFTGSILANPGLGDRIRIPKKLA